MKSRISLLSIILIISMLSCTTGGGSGNRQSGVLEKWVVAEMSVDSGKLVLPEQPIAEMRYFAKGYKEGDVARSNGKAYLLIRQVKPANFNVLVQCTTDSAGLINVMYMQNRDTFAVDGLTPHQADSLISQ